MRHSFLLTAWFLWLLAHSSRLLTGPVLPLIEDEFGISHAQAGRVFLWMTVGYCASLLTVPYWGRKWGYQRTLRFALITLTLMLLLMGWVPGVGTLSVILFIIGVTTGTILPSAIPLLTAVYGKEKWGKSLSVFDTAAPAGQSLAPLLAVVVLSAFPWRTVFWAMAAIAVGVICMFHWTAPEEEPAADQARGSMLTVVRNKSLVTLSGLWILASGAALGMGFLIPLYLVKERGIDLAAANQVFALGRGLSILSPILAGVLVDRFSCRRLLGWALAFTGVSLIGLALWPENIGLGVWVIAEALAINMFFPVGLILIARLTATGVRGAATGLVIGAGAGLGFGFTPWVLGAIADAWSFQVGIAALGGAALLSSLAVLRIDRV